MLRIADIHTDLIGKICKPTEWGVELEKEYDLLFNRNNYLSQLRTYQYCTMGGRYEMSLMFIDEKPYKECGLTFYCLKEVGIGVMGDWHWFTLDQLMICI